MHPRRPHPTGRGREQEQGALAAVWGHCSVLALQEVPLLERARHHSLQARPLLLCSTTDHATSCMALLIDHATACMALLIYHATSCMALLIDHATACMALRIIPQLPH